MEIKIEPSYYAVIPAEVRYCKELTANAKLLYGEITALSQREGYCWATNKYLAELYGVHINSISDWINNLCDLCFITVEIDQQIGNARKIWIGPKGVAQKTVGGRTENCKPYIYSIKKNNKEVVDEGLPDPLNTPVLQDLWKEWLQHRKELRKPLTPVARRNQVTMLKNLGITDAEQSLRRSLSAGWLGLFPPPLTNFYNEPKKAKIKDV